MRHLSYLTEHLAILELQNPSIYEFFEVQKRLLEDYEALKLSKWLVRSLMCARFTHLVIDWHEEAIDDIVHVGVPDLKGVDIGALGGVVLDQVLDPTHAEGAAAVVAHPVPHHHRGA